MTGKLNVREANNDDIDLIFKWRNREDIVALSEHQKKVTWDEHSRWYSKYVMEKRSRLYVINFSNIDIGLCRFDLLENHKIVSIYLISEYQSMGLGSKALQLCLKLEANKSTPMLAKVRKDNIISQKFFIKNNFYPSTTDSNIITFRYMLES